MFVNVVNENWNFSRRLKEEEVVDDGKDNKEESKATNQGILYCERAEGEESIFA